MTIAANLKHWRQVRGLTQPELAERAQIEQSYLSKLENGRSQPSGSVLTRLAEALEIDADTLMRDPSGNGRRIGLAVLGALLLLLAAFSAGYLASGYEVRKVHHEGARLDAVWALAPQGISIENVTLTEARGEKPPGSQIVGSYENADQVRKFARQLLDSGLLGTDLSMLSITQDAKRNFVIFIDGERSVPAGSPPGKADQ